MVIFKDFLTKNILIIAAISVALTEIFNKTTSDKRTRWKYAPLVSIVLAIGVSIGWSFIQELISWQEGIERGVKVAFVATAGYNYIKSLLVGAFKIGIS